MSSSADTDGSSSSSQFNPHTAQLYSDSHTDVFDAVVEKYGLKDLRKPKSGSEKRKLLAGKIVSDYIPSKVIDDVIAKAWEAIQGEPELNQDLESHVKDSVHSHVRTHVLLSIIAEARIKMNGPLPESTPLKALLEDVEHRKPFPNASISKKRKNGGEKQAAASPVDLYWLNQDYQTLDHREFGVARPKSDKAYAMTVPEMVHFRNHEPSAKKYINLFVHKFMYEWKTPILECTRELTTAHLIAQNTAFTGILDTDTWQEFILRIMITHMRYIYTDREVNAKTLSLQNPPALKKGATDDERSIKKELDAIIREMGVCMDDVRVSILQQQKKGLLARLESMKGGSAQAKARGDGDNAEDDTNGHAPSVSQVLVVACDDDEA